MDPEPDSRAKTFHPSERIAELNEIDKSVTTLLRSAGSAIKILSNSSSITASPLSPSSLMLPTTTTLDGQKVAFTAAASTYFSVLSSIDVRLRRQVYALEEANLVPAGDERDARRGKVAGVGGDDREVSAGGPLDASWLNSRARDAVGRDTERELWAQAREWVERLEQEGTDQRGSEQAGRGEQKQEKEGEDDDGHKGKIQADTQLADYDDDDNFSFNDDGDFTMSI